LPARNKGVPYVPGYDKAVGEHAIMLPNAVDEALSAQVSQGRIRRDINPNDADALFEGAVPVNRSMGDYMKYQESPDHISKHVQEVKILAESPDIVKTPGGHELPAPRNVVIANPVHRPNFGAIVRHYETDTQVAGRVQALVYRSHDGTLEYVLYRDSQNRVWFKSVSAVHSTITPQGVAAHAIDADALVTPLWEYGQQIPRGYAGEGNASSPSYSSSWKYISQFPDIQAWYAATGQPMPPAQ
jgi:hypothetical protein